MAASTVVAAILRDARLRLRFGGLLRMRAVWRRPCTTAPTDATHLAMVANLPISGASWPGPETGFVNVGCRKGGRGRARLHPRHRRGGPWRGPPPERGDALSARTQRLPAHRARQIDLPQFRRRAGIRRT